MANYIKRFKTSDLIRSFTILFIIFFVFLYFSLSHFTSFNDFFSSSSSSSPSHDFMTKEESGQYFNKRRKKAKDAAGSNNSVATRKETFEVKNKHSSSTPTTHEKYNSKELIMSNTQSVSADASSNRSSLDIDQDIAFEIKTEDDKFCQASPRNCYSPRCYSPVNFFKGGCIGSPYAYKSPSKFIPDENKTNSLHRKTLKDPMYFECPNRIDERERISEFADRDEKHSTAQAALENPRIGINNFKYQTSWMYPKWFDWNGKCIRADRKNLTKSVDDQFTMRGLHHEKDGLYRLHNVCIKANASLSGPTFIGYVPKSRREWELFSPWRGADDTFHVTKQLEPGLNNYFTKSHEVFHGSDLPGACYLDTKVMLYPISYRSDNLGHALHRFGSALRVIESAFGKEEAEAKKNVTIMYLVTDGEGKIVVDENDNAMNALYEALGTSWFSILGPQKVASTLKPATVFRKGRGARAEVSRLIRLQHFHKGIDPSKYTCFKEIVLWQNSYVPLGSNEFGISGGLSTGARDTPGAQTSFQIHGTRTPRDVETLKIVNERLRECGKLPPRRKMRKPTDPVKILFLVRSKWRRLLLQPHLIGYMEKLIGDAKKRHFEVAVNNNTHNNSQSSSKSDTSETETPGKIMNYSLQVAEMRSFTNFKDLIQLYSETDVIVGMYGAALTFSLFMPPGSLTIEFNFPNFRFAKYTGLNDNPMSEFGGNSQISGIHHLVFADPGQLIRQTHGPKPGASELLIGRPFIDSVFDRIECLLSYRTSASYESTLTPEFVMQELEKHSRYGNVFHLPTPSAHCGLSHHEYSRLVARTTTPPNLPLLVAEAASIHLKKSEDEHPLSASRHLRSIIRHRDIIAASIQRFTISSSAVRILIVEPCEARYSVLAESSFWRMLFARTEIVVAEFAAGKKACEELKQKRIFEMKEQGQQHKFHGRNTSSASNPNDTTSSDTPNSNSTAMHHPLDIINAKTKHESENMIKIVDSLREYYIKFCDYPCYTGLFNFIVQDCLIPEDCVVRKFRLSRDEQLHYDAVEQDVSKRRSEAKKYSLSVPAATDTFRSRALAKNSILFGFLRTPSIESSNDPNVDGERKNDNNGKPIIQTPNLFVSTSGGEDVRCSNCELLKRSSQNAAAIDANAQNESTQPQPTTAGTKEALKPKGEAPRRTEQISTTIPPSQQAPMQFSKQQEKQQHVLSKQMGETKMTDTTQQQQEAPNPEDEADAERPGHQRRNAQTDKKYDAIPTRPMEKLLTTTVFAAVDHDGNDFEEMPVKLSRKKSAEDHPLGGGKRVRGR